MANDVRNPAEPSVTTLVGGIISDAQELLKQQVSLLRAEIESDFKKSKDASISMAWGVGVCVPAALLLCFMAAHLLHWLTAPAGYDPAAIPLWACYGIAGVVFAALGALLVYLGVKKFESFNPLPDESAEALKENVQWLANPNRK